MNEMMHANCFVTLLSRYLELEKFRQIVSEYCETKLAKKKTLVDLIHAYDTVVSF